MTVDQFNELDEQKKAVAIFDAKKVAENFNELFKSELFQIDNFFVEVKVGIQNRFKRRITSYSSDDITRNNLDETYCLITP